MRAIIDTSVFYASVHARESRHALARETVRRRDIQIVFLTPVIFENAYLIGDTISPTAEVAFLRTVPQLPIEALSDEDWQRIPELAHQYRGFPIGAVDAAIIAVAERLDIDAILTFDTRHFRAIKPKHVEAFTILPGGQ
jgi:predicted nucleic acid-binding protein